MSFLKFEFVMYLKKTNIILAIFSSIFFVFGGCKSFFNSTSNGCTGIKAYERCSKFCEHDSVSHGSVIVECGPKDFVHVKQL